MQSGGLPMKRSRAWAMNVHDLRGKGDSVLQIRDDCGGGACAASVWTLRLKIKNALQKRGKGAMSDARAPGSRDGAANEAQPFVVDLTNCDREPIHIPGSVQPHGALLAVDPKTLRVVQAGGDTAGSWLRAF